MKPMDEKLQKVVKMFSYPVWFVIRDNKVDCTCTKFHTKQADFNCKKCLGTGKKIKLVRENAAHQNDSLAQRGEGMGYGEQMVVGEYYSLRPVNAKVEDIIVDKNDVDVIQRIYPERTNHNSPVYYRFTTSPMKEYSEVFLKNFKELLEKFGYG